MKKRPPASSPVVTAMTLTHPSTCALSQPDGTVQILCTTPWGVQTCRIVLTQEAAAALAQDLRVTLASMQLLASS